MPVKSVIYGRSERASESQLIPASVVKGNDHNAAVVATRALRTYYNKIKFFLNPTYGYNMNVAAGFGGTPEHIHDGNDHAYWAASAISGTWVFNSMAQPHSGTRCIDATATVDGDVVGLIKGSTIDLSGYAAITGWIYLSNWDDKGIKKINLYGWDTVGAYMMGVTVNLKDYIDIGLIGSYQKFIVPLADMGLTGQIIDSVRTQTVDSGPGSPPDYYLDDIQIEETGGAIEFKIEPDPNTWLHVCAVDLLFVDACASTLADATMPCFSYDKLLGLPSLINGLLYQGIIGGETRLTFPFKNLGDFLMFPGLKMGSYGSDGANTFMKLCIKFVEPIVLQPEAEDKLLFSVSDDLSGFLRLNVTAACRAEVRE